MAKSNLSKRAELFSALGDETRLRLVQKLTNGDALSISELSDGQPISRQAITRHLRVLEDVGLLKCVKEGRESRFKIDTSPLKEAVDLLETVGRKWEQRLTRLKMYTENTK